LASIVAIYLDDNGTISFEDAHARARIRRSATTPGGLFGTTFFTAFLFKSTPIGCHPIGIE